MDNTPQIQAEALHQTLAFAWRNRDKATEHLTEQILIAIAAYGKPDEQALASDALLHRRSQRKSQFELDLLLGPADQRPSANLEGLDS